MTAAQASHKTSRWTGVSPYSSRLNRNTSAETTLVTRPCSEWSARCPDTGLQGAVPQAVVSFPSVRRYFSIAARALGSNGKPSSSSVATPLSTRSRWLPVASNTSS